MQKKIYILLAFVLFVLSACSASADGELIHDDIRSDTDQLLKITEKANEEKRELEVNERSLFDDYKYKYYVGKFYDGNSNSEYEMNDLEKELVRRVSSLAVFVNPSESLSSEKSGYDVFRENVDELLDAEEIPDELVDKHMTYEKQNGVNETFVEDAKKVFNFFDEAEGTITDTYVVDSFLQNYTSEHLKVNDTYYMHNELSDDIQFYIEMLNDQMWEENRLNLHDVDELENLIKRAERY